MSMRQDKARFDYVIYIASTPEKVWNALFDPVMTKQYWVQHKNVSDWKLGSRWEHQDSDDPKKVDIAGHVIEHDAPRRLTMTWVDPKEFANDAKHSHVAISIDPWHDSVRLSIEHDQLEPASDMLHGITHGWPIVFSSLKSLLETGKPLPHTTERWTGPLQ
jgi:uncharacterized protein YndB with AHSA1/START domain